MSLEYRRSHIRAEWKETFFPFKQKMIDKRKENKQKKKNNNFIIIRAMYYAIAVYNVHIPGLSEACGITTAWIAVVYYTWAYEQ